MKLRLIVIILITSFYSFSQHQIGRTTITFNDPARTGGFGSGGGPGRQIQTEIYYPAVSAGNDVALAAGEFPIIVFGHGFAMSWDAYQNIWEHYVPMGYIMAFPRTEGGLIPPPSHQDFGLDLKIVTEKLSLLDAEAASLFFDKLNGNVAIMGHSMGGGASILASANNISIKTVVGLAPAETDPSAIASAANVTVPALIFSGGQDGVTPAADHHTPIYNALDSDCKTFVNIVGGAHCYFANSNTACDFGEGTSSTGISITRTEQQDRTYSILDHWLEYRLKDNSASYDLFLTAINASPATLVSTTTCSAGTNPDPLSITEQDDLKNKLTIYPNPTTGLFQIENMYATTSLVRIYSTSGKLVLEQEYTNQIDISKLNNGIYYMKIDNSTTKIVKY